VNKSIRIVMMKFILFLTFFMFFTNSTLANDVSPGGAQAVQTDADVDVSTPTSTMEKLMEMSEVQGAKESCALLKSNNENSDASSTKPYRPYKDLGDCIWGNLTDDQKDKISQAVDQEGNQNETDNPNIESTQFENKNFGEFNQAITPEMKAMTDMMVAKIEEGTYGTGEKKNIVGHDTYYEMAKQALGKNLVQATSYLCMNTEIKSARHNLDNKEFVFVFDDKVPTREDDFDLDSASIDDPNLSNQEKWMKRLQNDPDQAAAIYQTCMFQIQDMCYDNVTDVFLRAAKGKINTSEFEGFKSSGSDHVHSYKLDEAEGKVIAHDGASGNNYCKTLKQNSDGTVEVDSSNLCTTGEFSKTKQIACTIARQMKETRSSMKALEIIEKRFNNLKEKGNNTSIAQGEEGEKIELYKSKGEKSINSLTTFSSDELTSGEIEKILTEKKDNFKDCFNMETKQVVGDSDKCAMYIDMNRDQKEQLIAEYLLRRRTLEHKMVSDLDDDMKLKEAVMAQGYTAEQADDLIDIEDGKYIKEQLQKRFALESDAIHQQLLEKMKKSTTSTNGEVKNESKDQAILEDIGEDLANNVPRMKQLIRFNNIMSGFFKIDQNGEEKSNLVPLSVELKTLDDSSELKQRVEAAKPTLTDGSDEGEKGVVGFGTEEVQKMIDINRAPSDQ
jgi:hypothetical protein